jgi:hypothetical protein
MLGRHYNTVRGWCLAAERGEPTRLVHVQRNPSSGYLEIDLEEVQLLRERVEDDEDDL